MIKVLHCADIHLDTPFNCPDKQKSETRRAELRGTFTSMMLYAKTHKIDIMLIAGDMFDMEFVTRETVALVLREFAANPYCRFVISPGNHDPYGEDRVYAKTDFPENVYIFENSQLCYFSFDDVGPDHDSVDVYGYAFTSPTMKFNPFAMKNPKNPSHINLLCGHGDMHSPISPTCPITVDDIKNSRFDYIALGHIHNSSGIERIGDTWYGYSGCLEGRSQNETGYKGAIVAEISKSSGVATVNAKGVRFSKRRCENETVNVTGAALQEEVAEHIGAMLNEKRYGTDTSLKVTLEGDVSSKLVMNKKQLEAQFAPGLFRIEIVDRTLPLYDYDTFENDPTIRGALFEQLLPKLQSGTPEERATASEALRIALSAISGGEIV